MQINCNLKKIKEQCGSTSFNRGKSFFQNKKVTFIEKQENHCAAVVHGVEDFHVSIRKENNDNITTSCSCPKLASFDKDCQHIAAVLIALHERQIDEEKQPKSSHKDVTEEFLSLFQKEGARSSQHQRHFENRQVLDTEFFLTTISASGQSLLGLRIRVGNERIRDIQKFLINLREDRPTRLSSGLTFDTENYCFHSEVNNVIENMVSLVFEQKSYFDRLSGYVGKDLLVIPPSAWEQLLASLIRAPQVKLEHNGDVYSSIEVSTELLPLQFNFSNNEGKGYQLTILGMDHLTILKEYATVFYKGNIFQLEVKDCKRLIELMQILNRSGLNVISIPQAQSGFFIEKVTPDLRRLGKLTISDTITKQFSTSPLQAKLFLDRVGNRLLAGLEFHYDHLVINPLENQESGRNPLLLRDKQKEEEILALMNESSFATTEEGYYLHNEELEYHFLYYIVPKLQKLVQIYATTAIQNRIFRGNPRPKIRVKVNRERINWLQFSFEMDEVPERQIYEVLQALEEKRKYFRLRDGSLLSLETSEFQEIQHFLQKNQVHSVSGEMEISIEKSIQLLDIVEASPIFEAEESFNDFMEILRNPDMLECSVPESLSSTLRDYQIQGFKWMKTLAYYGFGGILADDMGLGKTIQSIAFIVSELNVIKERKQPVLIVCPSSLVYNWVGELEKFAPDLDVGVVDGNRKNRLKLQNKLQDYDVVITSYPLLRQDIEWLETKQFYTVFFDEAQAFKNPLTQTARAVKRIQSQHHFALTGTPIENSVEELWSIFHVVFPQLFLGLKEFSKLTEKEIIRKIRPFMLRRIKENVLEELPEKKESIESIELLPEQKKLYGAYLAKLRHDALKHLDKDTLHKNRIRILAGLTRLRQICCHPALFVDGYKGSSAKFNQLMELLEESRRSGRRVLIFSQFTKMLELIGRELARKGRTFFYLDGQTPSEERMDLCNRFNNGEHDLFLISLKAGGTGLNLASADTVILYDTWWNPAVEEQAADRVHRIGQKNVVQVIKLVARGTIEDKMNELQEKKRHLVDTIVDSEKDSRSSLTDEDLREILMI